MRRKPAGDAEAQHAAIPPADRALRHLGQLASGGPAHHQHAGPRRNTGLEGHADEGDDDAPVAFDCDTGNFVTVVAVTHHPVCDRGPDAIELGCH